jgi:hypothetical protein
MIPEDYPKGSPVYLPQPWPGNDQIILGVCVIVSWGQVCFLEGPKLHLKFCRQCYTTEADAWEALAKGLTDERKEMTSQAIALVKRAEQAMERAKHERALLEVES